MLTARIDVLLGMINALEKELTQERAENKALGRIVDQQERELNIMSAAVEEKAAPAADKPKKIKPPVKLGTVVFYTPPESMNAPVAPALVIGSHDDDGTVDLRVNLGYCQGVTDVQRVKLEDEKAAKGKDGKPVPQHNTYAKEAPKDED